MLRYDGRLPTPSACLHIVKVFVGLQSHNAPVRDSGQRENRSCTAFADKFRVFSFDFIGLQPTYGADWSAIRATTFKFHHQALTSR